MRPAVRTKRHLSIFVALLACAVMIGMPARGLTLCTHGDGHTGFGIGSDAGCPCPDGHEGGARPQGDAGAPPCHDLSIEGLRDLVIASTRHADSAPVLSLAIPTPVRDRAICCARASPPPERRGSSEGDVARARNRTERGCVVLLI